MFLHNFRAFLCSSPLLGTGGRRQSPIAFTRFQFQSWNVVVYLAKLQIVTADFLLGPIAAFLSILVSQINGELPPSPACMILPSPRPRRPVCGGRWDVQVQGHRVLRRRLELGVGAGDGLCGTQAVF